MIAKKRKREFTRQKTISDNLKSKLLGPLKEFLEIISGSKRILYWSDWVQILQIFYFYQIIYNFTLISIKLFVISKYLIDKSYNTNDTSSNLTWFISIYILHLYIYIV